MKVTVDITVYIEVDAKVRTQVFKNIPLGEVALMRHKLYKDEVVTGIQIDNMNMLVSSKEE